MTADLKKTILVLAAAVIVVYAAYRVWNSLREPEAVARANTRTLMDSETGELFEVELDENFGPFPHKNRKTGTMTLYPTEVCYARECGDKPNGTHVILNVHLGKPEPTYCPACGALVRPHNPGRESDSREE